MYFGLLLFLAYLLGSVPTSVWVSKMVFKMDIRDYGSGNAGATNALRYLGGRWSLFILFVDIVKGSLAVASVHLLPLSEHNILGLFNQQILLGVMAVLGHIYPVFAGFKGGKGVATMLGTMIVVSPVFTLIALASFIGVYLVCHYVALASMLGSFVFALCILIFRQGNEWHHWVGVGAAFVLSFLVMYKHRSNVIRLLRKEEDKTFLFKKKNNKQ